MKQGYVYVLCSRRNGTLYIGVTSDLIKRIYQHKNKIIDCCDTKNLYLTSHENLDPAKLAEHHHLLRSTSMTASFAGRRFCLNSLPIVPTLFFIEPNFYSICIGMVESERFVNNAVTLVD